MLESQEKETFDLVICMAILKDNQHIDLYLYYGKKRTNQSFFNSALYCDRKKNRLPFFPNTSLLYSILGFSILKLN